MIADLQQYKQDKSIEIQLETCWSMLHTKKLKVMDHNWKDTDARIRHLDDQYWIYTDEVNGYQIIREDQFSSWNLEPIEEE